MIILAYIAAILIGVSLGLIGSGGSILAIPVLVYLLGVLPVNATAYSLFIVGITSLVGSTFYMKKDLVDYKTGLIFAVPAFTAVFFTRLIILPSIPEVIFSSGNFRVSKQVFIMIVFAILMFSAAITMIRDKREETVDSKIELNYFFFFIQAAIIGVLTGLVGAGGGFLIIPTLVLLAKLPMKKAVGTSLFIIAINSLIGFLGDIGADTFLDWNILIVFSALAVIGIFIGSYLSKFISGSKLKPAFGWFVLGMSVYIIIKEIVK